MRENNPKQSKEKIYIFQKLRINSNKIESSKKYLHFPKKRETKFFDFWTF